LSGGDWIVGTQGQWVIGARFLTHAAPLMALMFAFAYYALRVRWIQYLCGALLSLSLLIPAAQLLGSESTGMPAHISIKFVDQIKRHPQARGMSWFDMSNRTQMRDITLIAALNETITTLEASLDRPVRLMSRQMGMVMNHLAQSHYGDILIRDRRGLNDSALLDCEPSHELTRRTSGLDLSYSHFFDNWHAYARCVERPDIIFDILLSPREMEALEDNGYSVIYEQNGYQGFGGNRVQQSAFYAVRNDLTVALSSKHTYLNAEYWREENTRLHDPAQNTRFVVIGHGRGLLEGHTDVLTEVADLINRSRPHYVFVLGDFVRLSSDEEWDQLEEYLFQRQDGTVIFVPGNHETRSNAAGDDSVYRRRVAPFPDVITTRHVNFLLLNSSLRLPEVKEKLEKAFGEIDATKPTLLLTHHNVWRVGPPVNRHMPTYSNQQFLPLIDGKVDAIIGGDGSGRFVAETSPIGVPAYRSGIGMKGKNQPLFFSIGDIGPDGILDFRPFEVSINPHHAWYNVAEPTPTLPFLLKNAPPIGFD
jgi:calcineurin-like phosphoesterase family protein